MTVQVGVLGPLRVLVDDVEVDLSRSVHRRLVACLAAAYPASVSATALIDEVWGEQGTSVPNLHVAVSRLRSTLGPVASQVVATRHGGYGLQLAPDDLDAVAFVNELRRARGEADGPTARAVIERALGRWRGEPYEDVELAAVEHEATRLRELHLLAVERLSSLEIESGESLAVVERLTPWVATLPLRESTRELLVTALHRLGRRAEALSVFEDGRRAVAEQLGVDPSPGLRRLHSTILAEDETAPAPSPIERVPDLQLPRSEVVGRVDELGRLRQWTAPRHGPVAVAFVEGEAGIGKTQLVRALVDGASAATIIATGHCWDHAGAPPLWPWEQLLTAISQQLSAASPEATELLDVLQRSRASREDDLAEAAPRRAAFFADVVTLLQRLGEQRPLLLCIEDGQWADRESVALAELVVSSLHDVEVGLVVTLRTSTGAIDGSAHVADDLVASLSRHRFTEHVRLVGLSTDEVAELVHRRGGAPIDEVAAERLRERTEGNPFFVEELVRLYGEETERSGHARSAIPSSIRAVIERRLRHLRPTDRSMLLTAALAGRSLDVPLLRTSTGLADDEVLDAVDRAVAAGLVVSDDLTGELRFSHMLVQEVLVASLTRPRASASHRRLADALSARPQADASRVAHHLRHVDDPDARPDTVRWLLLAARQAESRTALDDAVRLTRTAQEAARSLVGEDAAALRLDVELQLAALLMQNLGYTSPVVAEQWTRALALAREDASVEHVMAALWGVWLHLTTNVPEGEFGPALDAADMIATTADGADEPRLTALFHLARGQTRWSLGLIQDAYDDLRISTDFFATLDDAEILRIFPQHLGLQSEAWLAFMAAMVRTDPTESDELAAVAREHAARLGHQFSSVYVDVVLSLRSMWLDRPDEVLSLAEPARVVAHAHALVQLEGYACLPVGWAALVQDRPAAAAQRIEEMLTICRSINGSTPFCAWLVQGLLAVAQGRAGDLDRARGSLDEALALSAAQVRAQHEDVLRQVEADLQRYADDVDLSRSTAVLLARTMLAALVDEPLPADLNR